MRFEKGMSKNIAPGILRFVSMLFLIFGNGRSRKIALRISRFVSIVFLIFEKGMNKKNCATNFQARKYAFCNI